VQAEVLTPPRIDRSFQTAAQAKPARPDGGTASGASVHVLAVSGSLRSDSYNTKLLRAAAELLPAGVELELWDGLKAIPPYDEDDDVEPAPATVAALRAAIAGADGLLFATPEYNSSVPGQLKNALDWISRPLTKNPLRGKPVAVVGASTGAFGAVWAQAELRKVLGAIGARVVDGEVAVGHAPTRFEGDELVDRDLREQLAEVVGTLVSETAGEAASRVAA
jgi:chromate reductase, NAD(P)H dehydrogenase (quinone)